MSAGLTAATYIYMRYSDYIMSSCSPLTGSDLVGGDVLRDMGYIGTSYAVALVVLPCTENDWYVVVFQLKLKLVVTSPTSSFSSGTTRDSFLQAHFVRLPLINIYQVGLGLEHFK